MIELRITGEDAYEFSSQVATMATIFDIGTHPWEYQEILETIRKQHEHKAKMAAVREQAVSKDAAVSAEKPKKAKTATVETVKTETAAVETEKAAAETTDKEISDEELRKAYAGNKAKTEKAKQWKADKGLKSLTSMNQEQRKEFLAYMNA